ncbi:MAG: SSU ribosomal protein S19p (S15e), partial [uncultured Rubrobacteraceae bacterium]
ARILHGEHGRPQARGVCPDADLPHSRKERQDREAQM